jgi:hypothetical protein
MIYTWNTNKTKKQMEYLMNIHESISRFEEQKIREAISTLKVVLEEEKKKEKEINDSLLTRMELYDNFGDIIEQIIEATKTFINYNPKDLSFTPIDITEDDILALTDEFYSKLDKKWYQLFQKIFKERKINVKFSESDSSCLHIPYLDYFYLNFRKSDTVEGVIDPTHEYAHAISTLINPNNERLYYKSILAEVPSIFAELIACTKYKGFSNNPYEYDIYQKNLFDTISAYCEDIDIDYHNFKGEDSACLGKDQRMVVFDKENISLRDKITYGISYLIAIELLHIYNEDPKEALIILNKIIEMDDADHLSEKLAGLGINPGYSIERYSYSLHRKIDKKSNQSSINK